MDRDFRNPEDVARAGPERVGQSLVKVLRRGITDKPFVLRLRFEYNGGVRGPMLFIGAMSRAWSDYVNGNARAIDMVTGVCSAEQGEVGRQRLRLTIRSGRGGGDGNLLALNRHLRSHNAEAVFDSDDGDRSAPSPPSSVPPALARRNELPPSTPAAGEATSPEPSRAATDATPVDSGPTHAGPPADAAFDFAGEARAIKAMFEAFRAAPDRPGLQALEARIAKWRKSQSAATTPVNDKAVAFIDKLEGLLQAKGEAFVASRSG